MPTQTQAAYTGPGRIQKSQVQNLLREFIFILFDRLMIIIPIFLVVFIITAIIVVMLPPVYKSSAKFSLTVPRTMDPLQKENFYDYQNMIKRTLDDQKQLIFSDRVLKKVVEKFSPALSRKRYPAAISAIRQNLEVTPPGGETFEQSNVFYLTYKHGDPHKARKYARAITQAYLKTYGEMAKSRTGYSYDFFNEQTQELYDKMTRKETELRNYEKQQAIALLEMLNLEYGAGANVETGPNALLTRFVGKYHDLQEELAGLRNAINAVESELENREIPAVLPEMEVTGRAITVFKNKVAQLQIQLNEMKPQFKQQFQLYQQVEEELDLNISSMRKELERTVRAKKIAAESIEAKIREVENVIEYLKERIRVTAEEKSVYQHLQQEYTIAKEAYISSRDQLEKARLALAVNQEKQYLTLVDKPLVPHKPFKPNRPLLVSLGFFAGIFLGLAVALSLDHFDHSIKKLEDIDRYLEVPVLGSLPRVV